AARTDGCVGEVRHNASRPEVRQRGFNQRRTTRLTQGSGDMADKAIELSFVRKHPKGGGANFWAVRPSGDYVMDCRRGRELALEYMAFEHAHKDGPPNTLPDIISAMIAAKDRSGLVV